MMRFPFRIAWLALIACGAALVLAATPALLAEFQQLCTGNLCLSGQIHTSQLKRLDAFGLSLEAYGLLAAGLRLLCALTHLAVAGLIVQRRPRDPIAVLGALVLVLFAFSTSGYTIMIREFGAAWFWPMFVSDRLAVGLTTLFFLLFPSGRFVPRWAFWLVPLTVAVDLTIALLGIFGPRLPIGRLTSLAIDAWFVGLAGAQIIRYRSVSTTTERQQTKWIVYGVAVGYGGAALADLIRQAMVLPVFAALAIPHATWWNLGVLLQLAVPLTFGMAILRAGLYTVDIVAGRTLLYVALTTLLISVYVLVAGGLGALIQQDAFFLPSLIAAGAMVLLLAPLHAQLQRAVNRLLYGQRDEPNAALAHLSRQLAGTLEPAAVLPTIVETVCSALRLSYAAIVVDQGGRAVAAAASGRPISGLLRLPLRFQGETLGELILAPRAPGEDWSASDRRTLSKLSEHAGTAVHALLLTLELQQARARLISAREEERRRLRRDLHDGLGPTLASLSMQIDTAQVLLRDDPETGVQLLSEVQDQLKTTLGNLRQLVYALRPPALDQFGLVAAIREQVAREARSSRPQISVEAAELPALPAAVEVAAYYIAGEAITNVRRHAQASRCSVHIRLEDGLRLEVCDNGIGLPRVCRAGVGLQSMRERAAELGGVCTVTRNPGGGTRVVAWLPLGVEP